MAAEMAGTIGQNVSAVRVAMPTVASDAAFESLTAACGENAARLVLERLDQGTGLDELAVVMCGAGDDVWIMVTPWSEFLTERPGMAALLESARSRVRAGCVPYLLATGDRVFVGEISIVKPGGPEA